MPVLSLGTTGNKGLPWKNYGNSKETSGFQGFGERGMNRQSREDFQSSEILYMVL